MHLLFIYSTLCTYLYIYIIICVAFNNQFFARSNFKKSQKNNSDCKDTNTVSFKRDVLLVLEKHCD